MDLFGLVGKDLVHALADVPLEVDVLHEHLAHPGLDELSEEVVEEFGLGGEVGQERADEGVGGDAGLVEFGQGAQSAGGERGADLQPADGYPTACSSRRMPRVSRYFVSWPW
ncbi:hypothetical protein [Streptomyces olindensis]|uniref:hypothetical protein n=1 Tax=Streptomyces olindensis TaxID=358823 RepID=UPI0033FD1A44